MAFMIDRPTNLAAWRQWLINGRGERKRGTAALLSQRISNRICKILWDDESFLLEFLKWASKWLEAAWWWQCESSFHEYLMVSWCIESELSDAKRLLAVSWEYVSLMALCGDDDRLSEFTAFFFGFYKWLFMIAEWRKLRNGLTEFWFWMSDILQIICNRFYISVREYRVYEFSSFCLLFLWLIKNKNLVSLIRGFCEFFFFIKTNYSL